MSATPKSDYIIAATVIICSVILLTALTLAVSGVELFKAGGRDITIYFQSVTGLNQDSEVRYAGAPAGKILTIEIVTEDELKTMAEEGKTGYPIRITASLYEGVPSLQKGTKASVSSDTILSEKYLNIIPSENKLQIALDEGEAIYSIHTASIDDLTRAGQQTLDHLNSALEKIREDGGDIPEKLSSLVNKAELFMGNANTLSKDADELVLRVDGILKKHEGKIDNTLTDLKVVLQNLKVVSTYSKAVSGTLGQRPWRIVWGGQISKLPSEKKIIKSDKPIPVELPKR